MTAMNLWTEAELDFIWDNLRLPGPDLARKFRKKWSRRTPASIYNKRARMTNGLLGGDGRGK